MPSYTEQSDYAVATVDAIVLNDKDEVLLIQRGDEPFKDFWVLPGGRIELDDLTAPAAIQREVREEVNLDVVAVHFFNAYSRPDRDPRFHSISFVYICRIISGKSAKTQEALDFGFFEHNHLPAHMGFDHRDMIQDFYACVRNKLPPAFADPTPNPYAADWKKIGYSDQFKYVTLSADTIVENSQGEILLTLRAKKWCTNTWIAPGGHVKVGETLEEAAKREVREEANIEINLKRLFGLYYEPFRNPSIPTATAMFIADYVSGTPIKNVEVSAFKWVLPRELPAPLGFDYDKILRDYQIYLTRQKSI